MQIEIKNQNKPVENYIEAIELKNIQDEKNHSHNPYNMALR